MMNVAEIKSKYAVDGVGMTVTVDIESLRTYAKESLREAERLVENQANEAKRIKLNGPMSDIADPDWNRRWKKRQQETIAEQRRSVEIANRLLSEITGILDKAEAKLKEVK